MKIILEMERDEAYFLVMLANQRIIDSDEIGISRDDPSSKFRQRVFDKIHNAYNKAVSTEYIHEENKVIMEWEPNLLLKSELLKKIHTSADVAIYRMDVVAIFEDEKNLKEWCVANNVSWVRVGNGFNLKKE